MDNIKNKFVILEIKESNISKYEVEFDVNHQTNEGFNSYAEAKKKLNALIELNLTRKWTELQYKIVQVAFESAYKTDKKTA
jgi:L-rhamnose mutarotase|tara:strand:+ start:58 stop:300 length:243 start_codon:yes stop_codon:yes gene_type:complete